MPPQQLGWTYHEDSVQIDIVLKRELLYNPRPLERTDGDGKI
jgi:hypothetical protein